MNNKCFAYCKCSQINGTCAVEKKEILNKIYKPMVIPDYNNIYLVHKQKDENNNNIFSKTMNNINLKSTSSTSSNLPFKKRKDYY